MSIPGPQLAADRFEDRAVELLYWLADEVKARRPAVLTARAVFRHVLPDKPCEPWTDEHVRWVRELASTTSSMYVHGLGPVRLSAFIVEQATRRPPGGHFGRARYGPGQWERALGEARLLS